MSFRNRLQQLASESAIYGLSSIFGRLLNYLLVPFYTNLFPTWEYGVVVTVFATFAFLNVVFTYGMESAYLKFASGSEGRPRQVQMFSTITVALLGTSLVFGGIIIGFRDTLGMWIGLGEAWHHLMWYVAGIAVLDTLVVVPFAELRLRNQPVRFALIRLTGIGLNLVLNFVLILGFGWGIEAIFCANLLASASVLVLQVPLYRQCFRWRFDRAVLKPLLWFGLPFLPSGLGYATNEVISRFFLSNMAPERVQTLHPDVDFEAKITEAMTRATEAGLSPDQIAQAAETVYADHVVGVFGAVYKIGVFLLLFVQMFRFAWQPFFLQHAEDPDARPLFAEVFTLFTAVALTIVLAVSFFAQELVALPIPFTEGRTLIPVAYWSGLGIVPIVLMAYLFLGWYHNFSAGLYIEKKTKYFIHNTLLGSVVTLVINIFLVRHYGIWAAAWGACAAYGVMAVALGLTAQQIYRVPYQWGRVLRAIVLAGGIFTVWFFIPALHVWWAEMGLLAGFGMGLFLLRILPRTGLRTILHRP